MKEPIDWIFEIRRVQRYGFTKNDLVEIGKPAIHGGQIGRKYKTYTDKTISKLGSALYEQVKQRIYRNEIFISSEDFELWQVGKSLLYTGEEPVALSGAGFVLRLMDGLEDMIDLQYASLYFHYSKEYEKAIQAITNGDRVKGMLLEKFRNINFVYPSMEQQKRIVKNILLEKKNTKELETLQELAKKRERFFKNILFEKL